MHRTLKAPSVRKRFLWDTVGSFSVANPTVSPYFLQNNGCAHNLVRGEKLNLPGDGRKQSKQVVGFTVSFPLKCKTIRAGFPYLETN